MRLAFKCLLLCVMAMAYVVPSHAQIFGSKKKKQPDFAEQIDFEGMVMRYLGKEIPQRDGIEGIYSVSCIVTRRGGFLASPNRDKVVARKDNYAKVVILKDWPGSKREYFEISLGSKDPGKYPIVGEFNAMAEGKGLVYKHYEPETDGVNFTMIASGDIIDGVRIQLIKRRTITTKLSYLKLYPKAEDYVRNK